MRKYGIGLGLVLVAVLIIFVLIPFLSRDKKLVEEAKSLENLGNYDKALDKYQRYLMRNDDDYFVRLDYASLLVDAGHPSKASVVMSKLRSVVSDSENIGIYRGKLVDIHGKLASAYEDSARAMKSNNSEALYLEYMDDQLQNTIDWIYYQRSDTSSYSYVMDRIYQEYILEVTTEIAQFYWSTSDANSLRSFLSSSFAGYVPGLFDITQFPLRKWRWHLNAVFDTASVEYKNESYERAREHWQYCLDNYEYGSRSDSLAETEIEFGETATRYNIGLCYYNMGDYESALNIFRQININNPQYEKEKVDGFVEMLFNYQLIKEASAYSSHASEMFEDEAYGQARSSYRKAIDTYLSAGWDASNTEVCRLKYNMAISYYNDRMYKKALRMFREIQRINPGYDPELVQDMVDRTNELIDLFE